MNTESDGLLPNARARETYSKSYPGVRTSKSAKQPFWIGYFFDLVCEKNALTFFQRCSCLDGRLFHTPLGPDKIVSGVLPDENSI